MAADPFQGWIPRIRLRIHRAPSIGILLEGSATVGSPYSIQELFVFHWAKRRSLQQEAQFEVFVIGIKYKTIVKPWCLVESYGMYIYMVDLSVAVPLHVYVTHRP